MEIKDIEIEFLGHSGFLLKYQNKTIVIDPYNLSEKILQADLILITHSHYDHCSIKDIEKLSKPGTTIIIPVDAQSKIAKIKNIDMQTIEPGEEIKWNSLKIEALPAYNVRKKYHPKREGWMGYLIKMEKVIVYHAGDTDKIPEMSKLTGYGKKENEFVALLPVSGKYVMGAEEATEVASLISPDLCIPMHFGAGVAGTLQDAEQFCENCRKLGLKAKILEKI